MHATPIDDRLIGELFEVLDSTESLLSQLGHGSDHGQFIDSIIGIRRKLIAHQPGSGVYSAALLSAILDGAVNAIIISNERGIIERLNPAAEKMFGYQAQEIVGKELASLMSPPFDVGQYLRTSEAEDSVGRGKEAEGRRKDGSTFSVQLGLSDVESGGHHKYAAFLHIC